MTAPRMASQNSFDSKPGAFQRSVFFDGFNSVIGTGGKVAARWRKNRRKKFFIECDDEDEKRREKFGGHVCEFKSHIKTKVCDEGIRKFYVGQERSVLQGTDALQATQGRPGMEIIF